MSRIFSFADITYSIPKFDFLLPVGISFYTFQAIGYSIDVYRGTVKAEKNFLTYALFVTFFPQLVAGPIERTTNLLPQFKAEHRFDYHRVVDGMKLAVWGMFKKIAIADTLSMYVNAAYGDIDTASGTALAFATFLFAIQIFCDFSGYTDTAIGVAQILGFRLMKNFDKPYLSASISEFWQRWHISLSSWFKDYVYIPLGGNRAAPLRHYANLIITFLVSGLWHGAALHFVVWGLVHGFYLIIEHSIKSLQMKFPVIAHTSGTKSKQGICKHIIQIGFTFCLVCIAWVFFRAESLSQAVIILQKIALSPIELTRLFIDMHKGIVGVGQGLLGAYTLDIPRPDLIVIFMLTLSACLYSLVMRRRNSIALINSKSLICRWCLYYLFLFVFFFLATSSQTKEFIYFQF